MRYLEDEELLNESSPTNKKPLDPVIELISLSVIGDVPVLLSSIISPAVNKSSVVTLTFSDPVPESQPITIPDLSVVVSNVAVTAS